MSVEFAYRYREESTRLGLQELDDVVLLVAAVSDDGDTISAGTEGTVLSVYGEGESYVVEFAEPVGALATIAASNLRAAVGPRH